MLKIIGDIREIPQNGEKNSIKKVVGLEAPPIPGMNV